MAERGGENSYLSRKTSRRGFLRQLVVGGGATAALLLGVDKLNKVIDGQSGADRQKMEGLALSLENQEAVEEERQWYQEKIEEYVDNRYTRGQLEYGLRQELFGGVGRLVHFRGKGAFGPEGENRWELDGMPIDGVGVLMSTRLVSNEKQNGKVETDLWARIAHGYNERAAGRGESDPYRYS